MKLFTEEDKPKVQKKLAIIHSNLEMYTRYEAQLLSLKGITPSMKATGEKIPYLRRDKCREAYTILKKYGWLGEEDLDKQYYSYLLEAINCGDYARLLDILPYAKQGFARGKLSEEDYNHIIDLLNAQKIEVEKVGKTLK